MIAKVICSGCLLIAVLSSALVQTTGPRVELSLIVTDKANNSLTTLSKEDVHVFEDNVEQTVLNVERDERPLDLGLAIDSSGSVRTFFTDVVVWASSLILNRRPEDEIFIERFVSTDKIQRVNDFTSDRNALLESLKGIQLEGGQSAVVDGIYTAVNYVAEHRKGDAGRRKVVVVITDGEDRNSRYTAETLIKFLRERKVQVFILGSTVFLDDTRYITKNPRERAEKLLKTVAEESGGRAFFFRNQKELDRVTAQLVADLKGQFRITYQSANNDPTKSFRKVEVKVVSPQGEKRTAITPRGYTLEKP